jgi:hypothetical protein
MPLPRSSGSHTVVLDTGPLLTYLTLHYLDRTGATDREAIIRDVRSGSRYPFTATEEERFRLLLHRFKRLLTTSPAVAEALRLREYSLLSRDRWRFRELALERLKDGKVEDVHCPLRELCAEEGFRDLICRLGLTDASLIFVAAKERCLLLTDDRRMFEGLLAGAKPDVRLLGDYLKSPD